MPEKLPVEETLQNIFSFRGRSSGLMSGGAEGSHDTSNSTCVHCIVVVVVVVVVAVTVTVGIGGSGVIDRHSLVGIVSVCNVVQNTK